MQKGEYIQQGQPSQRAQETSLTHVNIRPFLIAGILLGLGLGGFFDGIVLHQILQWHHMVTVDYPATTVENLELNTLMDGFFHAATYMFTVVGLFLLWQAGRWTTRRPSTGMIIGIVLMGWGLFNLVEGIINHHLLNLHHVNETSPGEQWLYWDLGFLAWGALMLVGGWLLTRLQPQEQQP